MHLNASVMAMAAQWPAGPRGWRRRARRPIVRGDAPASGDLTATQWRALARIRAGRPDALLLWRREHGGLLLEISAPPNPREPAHTLVVVAFDPDGSVRVQHGAPGDGAA